MNNAVIELEGAPLDHAVLAAVLVHGRDQDAGYMRQNLVAPLGRSDVAYLLPQSPSRTWYAGRFTAPVPELEPELSAALSAVADAVTRARSPERAVVLAGFSQGGCLVAELLARQGRMGLAGAAVLTGALIGHRAVIGEVRRLDVELAGLPTEMVSSEYDEWVAPEYARATARSFSEAGADVRLQMTAQREHKIDDVAVAAVGRLLEAAYGTAGTTR